MRVVTGVSYEKLSEYKNSGFQLIGGALGDNTIDYRSANMKKPTIIIVGNEANGISEDVQKMCQCVKIPILGKAESLNAGSCGGNINVRTCSPKVLTIFEICSNVTDVF